MQLRGWNANPLNLMWLMPTEGSETRKANRPFPDGRRSFLLRRKGKRKEEEHELDRQIICSGKAYLGRVSGTALCKGAGRRDTARGQIPFLYGAGLSLSFAVCEGICDGRGKNRGWGADDTLLLYGAWYLGWRNEYP